MRAAHGRKHKLCSHALVLRTEGSAAFDALEHSCRLCGMRLWSPALLTCAGMHHAQRQGRLGSHASPFQA